MILYNPMDPKSFFPPLDPDEPYKYLWYQMSLSLDWRTLKDTVISKIDMTIDSLRDAVYLPT